MLMTALKVYNNILQTSVTKVDLGAFYTPPVLSEWVAKLACKYVKNSKSIILDPSSGDGALLAPVSKICSNPLIAVDINSAEFFALRRKIHPTNKLTTYELNSLYPSREVSTLSFWKQFFSKKDIGVVISNPPWGSKVWQTPQELLNNEFTLSTGQYDSYELFLEMMIKSTKEGTFHVFIIPDSIFLPEHKPLRELILSKTKIHSISRLGEGFFKGVYRGTCVFVLEKTHPDKSHKVECMRLNRSARNEVLKGNCSLAEAFEAYSHTVYQDRFLKNSEKLFDIDILDKETTVDKIGGVRTLKLSDYFISGRGVEISKSGKLYICDKCHSANPIPRKNNYINCKCGYQIDTENKLYSQVIVDKEIKNAVPLIVGEDIRRYSCKAKRYLQKDIKGIQYKCATTFGEKKLLIRKTGIGIKSAIDLSGAYTNQVVFHYVAKDETFVPKFITEYVQGILSSRVLMSYYLQKYGDNEWRSHPYITQKVISQLPIPDFKKSKKAYKLAEEIAENVKQMSNANSDEYSKLDIQIEKLVVKIFSLSNKDCKWVINTLKESEQLEPIRSLVLENHNIIIG